MTTAGVSPWVSVGGLLPFGVTARSTSSGELAPDYVTKIGWPSGSINAGRKESRMDKIEMVCRKGETAVQVIDLFDTS